MNAAPAFFPGAAVRKTAALCLAALAVAACGEQPVPAAKWVIGQRALRVHCVNRANGAAWDIALDRGRGLADGKPATFGQRHVQWTTVGSRNDLDAATGVLTVGRGSSTGGWTVAYACVPARQAET